jgi:GT2 family glycosyltransferase
LIDSGAIGHCDRFIIVDNASTEDGVKYFLDYLKKKYRAIIVSLPENHGWGSAVNAGIGISMAPYILLSNNDVEYKYDFHRNMLSIFNKALLLPPNRESKGIGILGAWRHTAHGIVEGGVYNDDFVEMDNVPAVAWMLSKEAMIEIGMLPEHGPCDTKGGNGEDTEYVMRMKDKGYLVGVPKIALNEETLAHHIDGY